MAKPLRDSVPTSTVARLFDGNAAANALASPTPIAVAPTITDVSDQRSSDASIVAEVPELKRDMILTVSTAETLDRLVELYRRTTRSRLTRSHVMRAVLIAIEHAFTSIEHEAEALGVMKLPSNAPAFTAERERLERRLAASVVAGLRAAALMPGGR